MADGYDKNHIYTLIVNITRHIPGLPKRDMELTDGRLHGDWG